MFNSLTNFSYKRNQKEAVGFYLAYLLLGLIFCIILVVPMMISGAIDINNYTQINKFSAYFSGTYCAIISAILLIKKKLWNNLGYILLVVIGIFLAVSTGVLLGLIIPAFITTKRQ